jgi:pyruvate/2-oxoglutarate dehydrogenase complex dihydrolipoamide dehydrogenase (E3) component
MGARVLLIEKDELGGACLNRGCIPTKSFLSDIKICRFEFAKRVKNLERAYDVRLSRTRDADVLPRRWMDRPIECGDFKSSVLETSKFERMKSE